ncbi:hypothetical protein EIN_056580 [Entamoeba invadens IP1]|uniref:hypothetical protein n=1 Tax=Entamoeba invadens IP1 TaxID=370355 RepID=UPI0002C3EBBD|nr:hypothetical protein EIN_056580 [Entamoeba invadens IP1]ELP93283.1 hypothetical protein EIN_056580 [Entamoeba invadens IP1]|eukprot:XP_004260054.1 hypothetical protein EIN_056580 [Entamoeba invadens IP1]
MMLSGPKRRPELTRSMRDFYIALQNKPLDVQIRHFIWGKGCAFGPCSHPEFDVAVNKTRSKFPWLDVIDFNFTQPINERDYMQEFLHDFDAAYQESDRNDWTFKSFQKHMLVNYHFYTMVNWVLQNDKDTDYFMFAEDDQLYQPDFFKKISDYLSAHNIDDYCSGKVCLTHYRKDRKHTAPPTQFALGWFGQFKSRKQMEMFLRFTKFSRYFDCGDAVTWFWCRTIQEGYYYGYDMSVHFGHWNPMPL